MDLQETITSAMVLNMKQRPEKPSYVEYDYSEILASGSHLKAMHTITKLKTEAVKAGLRLSVRATEKDLRVTDKNIDEIDIQDLKVSNISRFVDRLELKVGNIVRVLKSRVETSI